MARLIGPRQGAGSVNLNNAIDEIDRLLGRDPILGETALSAGPLGHRLTSLRDQLRREDEQLIDFDRALNIKSYLYQKMQRNPHVAKDMRGVANVPHQDFERQVESANPPTGRDERTVQREAERGEKVIPEVVDMITGTKLDTGAYLYKLKRLPQRAATRREETGVFTCVPAQKMVDFGFDFRICDMMRTTLDRRTFLTLILSGGFAAMGGFGAQGGLPDRTIIPKPFAHSPTVTTFAQGLYGHWHFADKADSPPLRHMIDAEFIQTGTTNIYYWEYHPSTGPALKDSEADKIERRRAAFFARLAVGCFAPLALRRAGYEQMAIDVAGGMLAPAAAQHTIGAANASRCRAAGAPSLMPMLESCAYGASAHASSTAFYADLPEIDSVHQTGWFCASALLNASFYDNVAVENPDEVWNFAAAVINTAIDLHDAEANATPS